MSKEKQGNGRGKLRGLGITDNANRDVVVG